MHPPSALPALAFVTSMAFAIAAGSASSVALAGPPSQQCPAGTILNPQTHACAAVKPPAAPAALPVIKAPPPVTHVPVTGALTTCAAGHYGASCSPCPGGPGNICSSHGTCSAGIAGSGACSCYSGFSGPDCQYGNGSQ
jgi:hypothetical protein